jgi:hypothetical protein
MKLWPEVVSGSCLPSKATIPFLEARMKMLGSELGRVKGWFVGAKIDHSKIDVIQAEYTGTEKAWCVG